MSSTWKKLQKASEDFAIKKYYESMTPEMYQEGIQRAIKMTEERLTKEYRSSNGTTITYGVRSRYQTIDFVIECLASDYQHILNVLNITYEYYVTENFPNIPIEMKLSGDLKETKICNNYQNGEALYTLSGKLVEV